MEGVGRPDLGFRVPASVPARVFAIAFSGQTVYLGGHFGTVNGASRNEVAAVGLATGTLTPFDPNIYAPANCPTCHTVETSRVLTIVPNTATHEIYICGGFWRVNGTKLAYNIGAFDPTSGALDPRFTIGDDGDTLGCAIHKGVIYFGGHFNYVGPLCLHTSTAPCLLYRHVAAANIATDTLLQWNPGRQSPHGIYTVRRRHTRRVRWLSNAFRRAPARRVRVVLAHLAVTGWMGSPLVGAQQAKLVAVSASRRTAPAAETRCGHSAARRARCA